MTRWEEVHIQCYNLQTKRQIITFFLKKAHPDRPQAQMQDKLAAPRTWKYTYLLRKENSEEYTKLSRRNQPKRKRYLYVWVMDSVFKILDRKLLYILKYKKKGEKM
jgi:hypothetical protein